MTFPAYWLLGLLNHMGWPRTKGLFIRKKVVSSFILWDSLTALVQAGIVLGALRPQTAVFLLADLFGERDWSRQPATELWAQYDPSEHVKNNLDKPPEKVIAGLMAPVNSFDNKPVDEQMKEVIAWEFVLTNEFTVCFHTAFIQGLIWGLSNRGEALARYAEQQEKHLKHLPDMISSGLDVNSPPTLAEYAKVLEKSVFEYERTIHNFGNIPKELSSLPVIAARFNAI